MNLDHLAIFVDLAETLNYRKTAERKHLSQPAVTQVIKSLEKEIGTMLFARSRNGVTITTDGRIFYQDLKPIINSYYKALQHVQTHDNQKQKLTIGLTFSPNETTFLPELLQYYTFNHPNVKVFLQSSNHNDLKHSLLNEDCDLILNTKDDFQELQEIKYVELTSGHFSAVIPTTNPLSISLNLEELDNNSLILMDSNWCPPKQFELQELLIKKTSNLDISYVNDVSTAYMMCKSSLGISIMPDFIAGKSTDLVSIVPINYSVKLSYGIGILNSRYKDYLVDFISFLKKEFLIVTK
ncbi:DNA-binding transcriptional LysR family regulator [Lactobacillus colini]|uniref:DNA-binding transcriptional LysR family regulator n=1 Tax=Lactobacillus colini TaxID=1819254 RepID=A0ABS4MEY0_9LACO|nr:LysR family transcriptional regulator [Lactobacillus colini]MBP2058226.1 DNA-binding transcriptional LysR family regulator [Lactobacillus colini]